MAIRTYSQLITYDNFNDRLNYLKLFGRVGEATFGFDRYLNQKFYNSAEWLNVRNYVIARDNGCDLGIDGFEILDKIYIHHLNPITTIDIENSSEYLLDPEYLISVSYLTHTAIHYGNNITEEDIIKKYKIIPRTKNDTCPWKKWKEW